MFVVYRARAVQMRARSLLPQKSWKLEALIGQTQSQHESQQDHGDMPAIQRTWRPIYFLIRRKPVDFRRLGSPDQQSDDSVERA
jgi:hypothetical protein